MPAVYGNDFSSMQAARDRDTALQDAQQEAAISHLQTAAQNLQRQREANRNFALQTAEFQNRQSQQAQQQQNFERQQTGVEQGTPWMRQQAGEAEHERDFDRSMRGMEFNQRTDAAARNAALQQAQLDLQTRAQNFAETQGNPTVQRRLEFFENDAKAAAARGEFGSPDEVQALYGGKIDPAMVNALAQQSMLARQQIASPHNFATSAANTANENAAITSHIAKMDAWSSMMPGHGHWGTQGAETAPPELQPYARDAQGNLITNPQFRSVLAARQALIAPQVIRIQGNKSFAQLIDVDPTTGKYVPATTAPSWMGSAPRVQQPVNPGFQFNTPGGGVSPPHPTIMSPSAQPAPSGNGFQFNSPGPTGGYQAQPLPINRVANPGGGNIRPGTRATQNGVVFQFDGQGWTPVGAAGR